MQPPNCALYTVTRNILYTNPSYLSPLDMSEKNNSWWRHQMETFSALLALCAGNSPVTSEFPSQRPVTRSSDVFLDLRLNKRLSKNCEAGDFRRHRPHYDVIVMSLWFSDAINESTADYELIKNFTTISRHTGVYYRIITGLCCITPAGMYFSTTTRVFPIPVVHSTVQNWKYFTVA